MEKSVVRQIDPVDPYTGLSPQAASVKIERCAKSFLSHVGQNSASGSLVQVLYASPVNPWTKTTSIRGVSPVHTRWNRGSSLMGRSSRANPSMVDWQGVKRYASQWLDSSMRTLRYLSDAALGQVGASQERSSASCLCPWLRALRRVGAGLGADGQRVQPRCYSPNKKVQCRRTKFNHAIHDVACGRCYRRAAAWRASVKTAPVSEVY